MRTLPVRFTLVFLLLSSCSVATLPSDKNIYQLPVGKSGLVSYQRTTINRGIKFDEFYRVAREWVRENKDYYGLQWERPIRKATLLHSGMIPASRIRDEEDTYNPKLSVEYYLTIRAKQDTCELFITTFEISGLRRNPLFIEEVADNKLLCQSLNREMNGLADSMNDYIRKNAEKLF